MLECREMDSRNSDAASIPLRHFNTKEPKLCSVTNAVEFLPPARTTRDARRDVFANRRRALTRLPKRPEIGMLERGQLLCPASDGNFH
jgi:hypothetical protein